MLNGKGRIGQYPQGELFHAVQSQKQFACELMYIEHSEGSSIENVVYTLLSLLCIGFYSNYTVLVLANVVESFFRKKEPSL